VQVVRQRDVDDVRVHRTEHLVHVGEPGHPPLLRRGIRTRGVDVAHGHQLDGGVVDDGLQVVA
jgi:hypothetical protein